MFTCRTDGGGTDGSDTALWLLPFIRGSEPPPLPPVPLVRPSLADASSPATPATAPVPPCPPLLLLWWPRDDDDDAPVRPRDELLPWDRAARSGDPRVARGRDTAEVWEGRARAASPVPGVCVGAGGGQLEALRACSGMRVLNSSGCCSISGTPDMSETIRVIHIHTYTHTHTPRPYARAPIKDP